MRYSNLTSPALRHRRSGLFFLGALALSCGGQPKAKEPEPCDKQTLHAFVLATAHINPEENGEPRPVMLRLYQVKTDIPFRNASFDEIWKSDEEKLGSNLLSKEELPIYPDSKKALVFERNPEAAYIVAAGLFRSPKGQQWFSSFELPPPPGEEACGAKCAEGGCSQEPILNPELFIRVDGIRVEDGSGYAEEFQPSTLAGSTTSRNL